MKAQKITNIVRLTLYICVCVILYSCQENRERIVYYDTNSDVMLSSDTFQSDEEIDIPFREEYGVKYVSVNVNGVGFDMIFDTGCSSTLISFAEAKYLAEKGKLTNDDILGLSKSQIADGSIVDNMVVNLKEVIVGNRIKYTDVKATVSSNIDAPLLLGNEVLDRHTRVVIDNENSVLRLIM